MLINILERSHQQPPFGDNNAHMVSAAAARWNERYRDALAPETIVAPEVVRMLLASVCAGDRILDLACGLGDAGLAFAEHGGEVTFVDISPVALRVVSERASKKGLEITTMALDLAREEPTGGPWDVIVCIHYLDRDLLRRISRDLAPGARLVAAIATRRNLEQHARPSARFLLEANELPSLVPSLDITHHDEAWRTNGVHEAWLVATRRQPSAGDAIRR